MQRYGVRGAIQGALDTPGGYLDATPSNPNTVIANNINQRRETQDWNQFTGFGDMISGEQMGPFRPAATTQPTPTNTNPFDTNKDETGDSGSALIDAFLQLFEGQYYTDPTEYYNATLGSIDRTADEQRGRARDEAGRSRTSLLDQVAQLFEQLDTEERKGKGNIASYYGGLGDLYQSSQGVREQEFAGDIAKERGRVGKERDTSNADIDRWLSDQMTSIDQTRQGAIGQQFGSAMDIRNQFAEKYQPNLVNTKPGAVNVTDTSALLKNLNAFLTPSNVSQRYRGQSGSQGDVYSYLNPLG